MNLLSGFRMPTDHECWPSNHTLTDVILEYYFDTLLLIKGRICTLIMCLFGGGKWKSEDSL